MNDKYFYEGMKYKTFKDDYDYNNTGCFKRIPVILTCTKKEYETYVSPSGIKAYHTSIWFEEKTSFGIREWKGLIQIDKKFGNEKVMATNPGSDEPYWVDSINFVKE